MKPKPLLLLAMFLIIIFTSQSLFAEKMNGVEIKSGQWRGQEIEYLEGEILVGLKSERSEYDFALEMASSPASIVRHDDGTGFLKLKVDENTDLFEVIADIEQLPSVRYAEPNMVDRLFITPDDPMYNEQWHYHNTGQTPPGGTPDADIDCPEGWDISTGSDTVIVGVLDSGIPMQNGQLSHPDLDDPNRYIIGTSVIDGGEPLDDNGHGTHVSGTIAAESNNGIGVAGVAWNVKVMAIKVFTSSGSGSHEYFRDGCFYGVDNGCKVLNYSGGGSAGATKEWGVAYADSNGVVLCAAAGNNNQGSVSWPGAYATTYSNTICVSSTDPDDQSSDFSSIGPEVTISAPGGSGSPYDADDIISTFPNYPCYLTTNYGLPQDYSPLAGTSMATPHAAGLAALILSMNPGLSPDSVRQVMINTSDDLGPAGFDNQFGYGRINVFNALSQMGPIVITHTPLPDTKDSLNDYEAVATVWSNADLVSDSVILYYEINSTWYEEVMLPTGGQDEFSAFIPTQSPGTTINYYIYAQNIDGEFDQTDTYSFYVIDYGVILEPELAGKSAPALDTAWYDMHLVNNGIFSDEFNLSLSGNLWDTQLFDTDSVTPVYSSGLLVSEESFDFMVRVLVPSSYEGEYDSVDVTATSVTDPAINAISVLTTTSAGQPWEIPFTDIFATASFDIAKWESYEEAEVNDIGIDEPSAPYSANLNGETTGGDVLITEAINLKDESNIVVEYAYQQTGGAESPDAGDDLIIEYLNQDSVWIELNRHLGADDDMTEFEEVELPLPSDAMHAGFRLKIRCTATAGAYDDWFVDDIYVGHPSDYDVRVNPAMQSQYGPAGDSAVFTLTVINRGYLTDEFDLSSSGDWDMTFFDAGGTHNTSTTGLIPGGDSVDIVAKVAIPAGTPLHDAETITAYATSQGDPLISAYALVEAVSAGEPAPVPWTESFPDDTLHIQKWFDYIGVSITTAGQNPPSDPYSMRLDGGVDTAATQLIDLSGQSGVLLSYYYQRGGMSDKPEAGDNLWVDYRNSSGNWVNLFTHEGADTAMQEFEYMSFELPADAHHQSLQVRLRSYGEASGMDNWYVDDLRIDFPPAMVADPGSFEKTLTQGDTTIAQLVIENSGQGGLIYNIDLIPHLRDAGPMFASSLAEGRIEAASHEYPDEAYLSSDLPKGEENDVQGMPVRYDLGGPDQYGYYWADSDEPSGPKFDWTDISTTGVDIIANLDDDNYYGPIKLDFDFPFYGALYDEFYIGSNGLIGFDSTRLDSRISQPIPYTFTPNAILAVLWDDLNPDDADNPESHVYVDKNSQRCVIQFSDYPEYRADPGDVVNMQVIINADGSILYQYLSIAPGFTKNYCTVGIESHDGADGLEVVYRSEYLKDSLAIEFFKPYDWLRLDHLSGEIAGGESDTIDCQFVTDIDFEPGIYTTDIVIENNDPDNNPLTITAELELIEFQPYTCGDANGDDEIDVSDAVLIVNYAFSGGNPPDPLASGDANCDQVVDVSDAVTIINYAFAGGNAPCDTDGDGQPDC